MRADPEAEDVAAPRGGRRRGGRRGRPPEGAPSAGAEAVEDVPAPRGGRRRGGRRGRPPEGTPSAGAEAVEDVPAPRGAWRSSLQRLDDRAVPVLQRGAHRVAGRLGAPLRWAARQERRVARGRLSRVLDRNRHVIVLLAAAIAFAGSYVHLQRYPHLRDASAGQASGPAGEAPPGSRAGRGAPDGGAATVGPVVGDSIEAYVTARRRELEAAGDTERRVAVVSFARYLTAEEAAARLGGELELFRAQLRLPAEGEQPVEVGLQPGSGTSPPGGDLVAAVQRTLAEQRDQVAGEEQAVRELLESGTVDDEAFAAEYGRRLERLAATRELLDAGTGAVYAVVVGGAVGQLRALAGAEDVRLVDLAPPQADPDRSRFFGLLPEDTDAVTSGAVGR